MSKDTILVVDDERNTRLTLEQALEPLGYELRLAASGEEALAELADSSIALVLLDLRMPGVDGLEVLRHIERDRPDLRVLILTAHGTVDSAVEVMKHGAADVIRKPFSVEEIRALVRREMDPALRADARKARYAGHVREGRRLLEAVQLDAALAHLHQAIEVDPDRPEAHNLIGVIEELRHNRPEAQRHYRTALDLDAAYTPARENLDASTGDPATRGRPSLGEEPR